MRKLCVAEQHTVLKKGIVFFSHNSLINALGIELINLEKKKMSRVKEL